MWTIFETNLWNLVETTKLTQKREIFSDSKYKIFQKNLSVVNSMGTSKSRNKRVAKI